jgi:hypothetical protein
MDPPLNLLKMTLWSLFEGESLEYAINNAFTKIGRLTVNSLKVWPAF